MKLNGFYRHKNFLDVYVYGLIVQYSGPKYIIWKVEWWNKGKKIFSKPARIKVQLEDLQNWRPCDESGASR